MTFEILVLLLVVVVVVLSIPLAVNLLAERPAPRSAAGLSRSGQSAHAPSPELLAALTRWYAGKVCVFCRQPLGPLDDEPRPGLLDRQTHRTLGLHELASEGGLACLERLEPVCASCYTAGSFRLRYPDLATERTATPLRDRAVH